MLTSARLADTQLRMLPATPMYCQQHITGFIIDIDDNVSDQRPQQLRVCGLVFTVRAGLLDIPFAASKQCKGAVMVARDAEGAVRYLDAGQVPIPASVLKFHRACIDQREAVRKKPIDYNAIVGDIFSISRGYLVAN